MIKLNKVTGQSISIAPDQIASVEEPPPQRVKQNTKTKAIVKTKDGQQHYVKDSPDEINKAVADARSAASKGKASADENPAPSKTKGKKDE